MKTNAKKLTIYGNHALVQVEIRPETKLAFRPGEPELRSGGLVITEASGSGIVGKLVAVNHTDHYLLLTDADVLTGAKQNRVLNKSFLIPPHSKTGLDVSCVERLRWHYTSPGFSSPADLADHDLRKEKTRSVVFRKTSPEGLHESTQSLVWRCIGDKMNEERIDSSTESYTDYLRYQKRVSRPEFPVCHAEPGCNGLAVLADRKLLCIDLFGREDVFGYYFPKLRDSAFRMAGFHERENSVGQDEAFYKVLDALDEYEKIERIHERVQPGAGSFSVFDGKGLVGFDLSFEGQIIHNAIFAR